jgi:hypothetical protein
LQPENVREVIPYTSEITKEALGDFIDLERVPLTIEFTAETSKLIFGAGRERQIIIIAEPKDLVKGAALYDAFKAASATLRAKKDFIFVTLASDNIETKSVLEFFDIADAPKPVMVGYEMGISQKKFKYASR